MEKIKFNLIFSIGLAYIFFWVGIAVESVGRKSTVDTYTWETPVYMLIAVSIPFVVGILSQLKE